MLVAMAARSWASVLAKPFVDVLWVLLFMLPVLALGLWLAWKKRTYRMEAAFPFRDAPLRPPGESTRVAAEAVFEKLTERLLFMVGMCGVAGVSVSAASRFQGVIACGWGAIVLLVSFWVAPRVTRLLKDYQNLQLGFRGERLVGEQLNQLLARGFHVFHDVPFDGFNIDHVVVGAPGVFAIETKTRRKRRTAASATRAHVVNYDGSVLTWPSGMRNHLGLDQARRNARSLGAWLAQAAGESVACRAVLTFPGWWIERSTRNPAAVAVIATRALVPYLTSIRTVSLSPAQVQRISYQLSNRCRLPVEAPERLSRPKAELKAQCSPRPSTTLPLQRTCDHPVPR